LKGAQVCFFTTMGGSKPRVTEKGARVGGKKVQTKKKQRIKDHLAKTHKTFAFPKGYEDGKSEAIRGKRTKGAWEGRGNIPKGHRGERSPWEKLGWGVKRKLVRGKKAQPAREGEENSLFEARRSHRRAARRLWARTTWDRSEAGGEEKGRQMFHGGGGGRIKTGFEGQKRGKKTTERAVQKGNRRTQGDRVRPQDPWLGFHNQPQTIWVRKGRVNAEPGEGGIRHIYRFRENKQNYGVGKEKGNNVTKSQHSATGNYG